jgi:hypothetical protein
MSGPVATLLSGIKQDLTGDPALLETKFEAPALALANPRVSDVEGQRWH